jgi:hypothetical protein
MLGASNGQIITTSLKIVIAWEKLQGHDQKKVLRMYTYVNDYINNSFNVDIIQFATPQLYLIKIKSITLTLHLSNAS